MIDDADPLAGSTRWAAPARLRDTTDASCVLATAGFVTDTKLEVDGGSAHGR